MGDAASVIPAGYQSIPAPFDAGGVSQVFHDTALSYYNGPSTGYPLNQSILDSLALQFSSDFGDWLIGISGDQSFVGVAAIQPTGLYDEITIDYFVDGTCKTRVMTPPVNEFPRELGHWDRASDSYHCGSSVYGYPSCVQSYGPPVPDSNSSSNFCIDKYLTCLQDGRLDQSYIGQDCFTCGCCTVIIKVVCLGPIAGAVVTVSQGGMTVFSGATDSNGEVTFTLPSPGTYMVSVTDSGYPDYNANIDMDCGGEYVIFVCCATKICVTGCPSGNPLSGASVTIKKGSMTIGSCTTDSSGCCSILIGIEDTYEVIVSATGYKGYDGNKSLVCDGTVSIALQPITAPPTITFTVMGCCSFALPGAMITLSDGQTCTTDSLGQCNFSLGGSGLITYMISKTRFATATGSVTISNCQTTTINVNVTLDPAAGYACGPSLDSSGNPRADPIPTTLIVTDSIYGTTNIIYDPVNKWWFGELSASYPGGCGCPSSSFIIGYVLGHCSGSSGTFFQVNYTSCEYVECFSHIPTIINNNCPSDSTITAANPCVGQPDGTFSFAGCSVNNPNVPAGFLAHSTNNASYFVSVPIPGTGDNWTMPAGLPFDLTATIAACNCHLGGAGWVCTTGSYTQRFAYNSGGTITVTE